ncbi:hypothetical protein [uncultured Fibrella sp.]|uniref:hypothetical protein n=1 Tax=uncultured Fibrella sp. TaxID=1284596 RepID=UPI0035CB2BCD
MIQVLRESIKSKYRVYHLRNRDRYPDFDYNTNRANYQPLRDSFEEEFYEVRKIDRASPNVCIPSTHTLALIFSDNTYVPSTKILNTCQSYALGPTNLEAVSNVPTLHQPTPLQPSPIKWLFLGGLVCLLCLGVFIFAGYVSFGPPPSGLVIDRPTPLSRVPQEVIIDGKATNAKTVWIGVRAKSGGPVWIQPPILVQENSTWIGVIYVGRTAKDDEGLICQIRAFVNPATKLTSGDMLENWPDAELSSRITEVSKGAAHN